MDVSKELRKLPVEGYIWLNIRAANTEVNANTHSAFKLMAKLECDDNYTQALKTLLEAYDNRSKSDHLQEQITALETRIAALEEAVKHKDKEDEGTF